MNRESATFGAQPEIEPSNPEILAENLNTLVNLLKADCETGLYKTRAEQLSANHALAIAESVMVDTPDGQKQIKNPYEFLLRMRVARQIALEALAEKTSAVSFSEVRIYERLDMPNLPLPKEWIDERLKNERLPDFRQTLERERAKYERDRTQPQ